MTAGGPTRGFLQYRLVVSLSVLNSARQGMLEKGVWKHWKMCTIEFSGGAFHLGNQDGYLLANSLLES